MPKLTRRALLAGAAASTLATPSLAATVADSLKGSGSVVVATWGGAYTNAQAEAFFKPFTQATGINVITAGPPDMAKMNIMKKANNIEWDLVTLEGWMLHAATKNGLLQKLDYGFINKIINKDEYADGSLLEYGFPTDISSWVMIWNKNSVKEAPQSWADIWNVKKFPGRRAFYAKPKPLLEYALLADGVTPDKLYPLDLDRAFKSLNTLKPHITAFFEAPSQGDLMMQNGEVDFLSLGSSRAFNAAKKGLPVGYTYTQGVWEQGYWSVPEGARNRENAMKLIAWMGLAERQAAFMKIYPQGLPNKAAYTLLTADERSALSGAPENLAKEVAINSQWWADNSEAVNRRWLEWYVSR